MGWSDPLQSRLCAKIKIQSTHQKKAAAMQAAALGGCAAMALAVPAVTNGDVTFASLLCFVMQASVAATTSALFPLAFRVSCSRCLAIRFNRLLSNGTPQDTDKENGKRANGENQSADPGRQLRVEQRRPWPGSTRTTEQRRPWAGGWSVLSLLLQHERHIVVVGQQRLCKWHGTCRAFSALRRLTTAIA